MHKNKILHRDIKPENIVLVLVKIDLYREMLNYVISDGQSIKNSNYVQHFVEHLSIFPLNSCRDQGMMRK